MSNNFFKIVFMILPRHSFGGLILTSALKEQHCSYLYLYLWDYRCWQVKNETLPVCCPLRHLSFCQGASKKANGFHGPAERFITVIDESLLLQDPISESIYSVCPEKPIYNHILLKLKKKKLIILDEWNNNLCICLTRKWICTEPISKTSLAWRSVTGPMTRMKLGFTLVRYVVQGALSE